MGASQKRKAGAEGGGGAKKPRPKRAKKDAAAAGESMNGVVDPEAEGGAKVKVEEAADG